VSTRAPLPWRSLALAAAALVAAAAPGALSLLQLDRGALLGGEAWRLVTGHLVHASPAHLWWDVLPLVAIGFLFEQALRRRFWIALAASTFTVSLGLLLLDPALGAYCGLSGVLNALWVAGALLAARAEERDGRRHWALVYRTCVLAGLAKVAAEAWLGVPLLTGGSDLGAHPVPLAHALGALGGLAALVPSRPRREGRQSERIPESRRLDAA
jgi:rhomboid family GlyGly-CTERM serine protease